MDKQALSYWQGQTTLAMIDVWYNPGTAARLTMRAVRSNAEHSRSWLADIAAGWRPA